MRPAGARDVASLRAFGLLMAAGLTLVGLWPLVLRREPAVSWALAVSGSLTVLAVVAPRLLDWPYRAWMALGALLGAVNTRLVLGILFYGLVTPIALAMRLGGYDPLGLRFERERPTYRMPVTPRDPRHMDRQF